MNPNKIFANTKDLLFETMKIVVLFSGVITFGIVIWYIVCISKGFYHSDCTDTIFWTQAMFDGKTIMNPDFGYACLLPFGGNILMFPFVSIWGVSMKAQLAGMVLFAILFTLSLVYMCRTMGLNYKWCSLIVSSVLLVLSASPKLREIFWEHIIYYSLGILFLMLGLGLIFAIFNNEKLSVKHLVILFVWTMFCSTNGSQALAIYCLPAMGAIICERFFETKKPLFSKDNLKEGVVLLVMLFAVLTGLILAKFINKDIEASYQIGYSGFDQMSDWANNFLSILPEAFRLFGITIGDKEMYSLDGIFILLKIAFVLVIWFVPVIMLIMYRKFKEKSYRIMILAHTILSLIIIVCWVFGKLNTACWRLSPIFVTGTILCIMCIRWLFLEKIVTRFIVVPSIFISFCLLILFFDIFDLQKNNQTESNRQLESIATYLENRNLEYGYGTFWNAGAITLLTDSEVKVRNISQSNTGKLNPRMYQSNSNWFKDNSYDKYFIILDDSEYWLYQYSDYYIQPIEYHFVEEKHILVYDFNIMELTE